MKFHLLDFIRLIELRTSSYCHSMVFYVVLYSPCSLLISTGANSSGLCSTDVTPPNSLDGFYIGKLDCVDVQNRPWRLRNSSFFQWRFVGWLLYNLPSLFRHFASFLLGAAAYALFFIPFFSTFNDKICG